MLRNQKTFPLTLSLLLSFGVYLEPTHASENRQLIVAQTAENRTTFPLPSNMPEGSVIKISSSQNVEKINNNLQEKFESEYSGSKVEVNSTDSDSAIEAVVGKKADLAAISRPLTQAEAARGLKTVPINKEKIAIIVGENNPYNGNLTIQQFAQIFRGEITNWSEIGGSSQPIKLIDRADTNDTRRSFPSYPVFQNAEFKTGSNATVPLNTEIEGIAKELATDGISYAPVSAVQDLKGIKVVKMHQTLPNDSRYPFSQPNLYVYQGEPSDAVKGFLGFVTAPIGQGIIQDTLEIASLPGVSSNSATTPNESSSTLIATTPETTTEQAATDSTSAITPATTANESNSTSTATTPETTTETKSNSWFWFLLPLALLIPLLAFLIKKGKDSQTITNTIDESDRELVGAGVGRTTSSTDRDDDDREIVAETALATGLGAAAIADRRQEQSNLPNQVDLDAPVEGVRNKFEDLTTNFHNPDVTTNLDATVDNVDSRLDNATTNLNPPDVTTNLDRTIEAVPPKLDDVSTNIATPEATNLDGTVAAVPPKLDDVSTNIATSELPNLDGTVEHISPVSYDVTTNVNTFDPYINVVDIHQKFDDLTTNLKTSDAADWENIQGSTETKVGLGDRLNPNLPDSQPESFLDKVRDKTEEIIENATDKASEIKDNLTNNSDRQE